MPNNGPVANNREIERKFLLKRLPDKLKGSRCYIIEQGYLASEPAGRQVRLRKKGSAATLTFKVGRGSHREEREIRLSPKQFDSALARDCRKKIAEGALRNSLEKSSH